MIVQADNLNLTLIADNGQILEKSVDDIFSELYSLYGNYIPLPNFNDQSLAHFFNIEDQIEYIAEAPTSWSDLNYPTPNFLEISKISFFYTFFPGTSSDDISYAFSQVMRTYWKVQFCKAFKCKLDYAKLPFLYGSLKDPFQTVWLTHGIIDNLTDFAPRQFKFSVSPNDLSFRYEVDDFYDFVALCLLLYLKNPVYSKLTICPICGKAITKKRLDAICCCTEHAAAFGKIKIDFVAGKKDTLSKVWTRARKRTNKMANVYDWQEIYNQWYLEGKALYTEAKKAALSPAEFDKQLIELWDNLTKGQARK